MKPAELPKLAAPARRALASARIATLEDFTKFSEAEIGSLHGIGKNALLSIKAAMEAARLSFAKQ